MKKLFSSILVFQLVVLLLPSSALAQTQPPSPAPMGYPQAGTGGPISPGPDLSTYSLSFPPEPLRFWWPTAPNSVQQVDAAIWKDGDGTRVKELSQLSTQWQFDPDYFEVTNTSSSYMDKCPVTTVSSRPCLWFTAHIKTRKVGKTSISLEVTDSKNQKIIWNSTLVEVYQGTDPTPLSNLPQPSQSPQPTSAPTSASPIPKPIFIPESKISEKEFKEIKQEVKYLQGQLEEQQQQINQTKGLLDRILSFLRSIFNFK